MGSRNRPMIFCYAKQLQIHNSY
uniref:Uncharacterized protein n=1 Tax=Anguilla anguilla TaxID=7936 RepID=A0A0E9VGS2_ANGAN